MKRNVIKKIFGIFLVLTMVTLIAAGCSKSKRNKIVIKGSTTVLPITQKCAEAYRKKKKVSISIEGSGSGNGIKALIDGSCDIANSSRAMKGKEIKKAKEKGINAEEHVVAYDMIVPVIHPENPVKNVTMNQLKAIYSGSISNWKELGGADKKIVVISRDTSSGTYEVWHKKVMQKTDVRKDALLQASNGAVASAIATNVKAIGYIGFGYINQTVKPIMVNNVVGTLENGKSGKFPISRKLFMYSNKDRITAEAKAFIDYIVGTEGQSLVKKAGFIPL
ncbi:MAG: PstS family phosphate ABC transporter substrate-binding protein [bacterium]|nr:PstS family phosphate ABC transporter substrate-binding protein [bacterium]